MTQQMQPDLSVYSEVDPDDIYNSGGKSLTFFYTGTMYTKPYPTNHDDMLRGDPEMFYDVFPDFSDVLPQSMIGDFLSYGRSNNNPRLEAFMQQAGLDPFEVSRTGGSRGKALKFGDAILGRVGEYQGDVVMAIWSPVDDDYYEDALGNPEFIEPIRRAFGNVGEMIVVGAGQPSFWSEITGEPMTPNQSPQPNDQSLADTPAIAADETVKKKYTIDGQDYTAKELGMFRGQLHSSARMSDEWRQAASVLCSDDLRKYPELIKFRPAICPRKDGDWRKPTRSRAQKWVDKSREIYTKEKEQGKSPSTGLLYPAWRAHSESRKFLTFRDFLVLDA